MRCRTVVTTVAVSLFALAASAGAAAVPIVNAGFESPLLADGDYDRLVDNQGWGYFDNAGELGAWNPGSLGVEESGYGGNAPEGQNIGFTYPGVGVPGGFAQVLAETLTAGMTYTLTVEVGNTAGYEWGGYSVQLLAGGIPQAIGDGSEYAGAVTGGVLLAQDDNTVAIAEDTFETSIVRYTYDPAMHAESLGEPLQIRLLSLAGEETDFDDVRLEASPAAGTLAWRTDFAGDWPTVNWTGDGGTNWVAPAGGEKMIVDSAAGLVNVDSDLSAMTAVSLAIGETAGGAVDITPTGMLVVTGDVAIGPAGTLRVDGSLTAAAITVDGGLLISNPGNTISTGVLTLSAGVVTAAGPITITDTLAIGDEPAISVTGGSFGLSGADLLNNPVRTLTLQGGRVRLGGQGVAGGESVGVNFLNADARPLAPGDVAGVMPAINWNNTDGRPFADTASITGPIAGSLVDNAGNVVTDIDILWIADDTASTDNDATNGDEKMMTGYLSDSAQFGSGISVSVTDVPYATYDVYAYMGSADGTARGRIQASQIGDDFSRIDMADFQFTALSNGQAFPESYVKIDATSGNGTPSNWAVWTGLTESNFELYTVAKEGLCGIQGLQIVNQAALAELDMSTTTLAVVADTTLDVGEASVATFAAMRLGAGSTLTVEGSVALATGGSYDVEFRSATAGKLVSPGLVALQDTSLNVVATGGDELFKAGSYVLVDAGALDGTFDSVTPLGTYVAAGTNGLTYGPDGTVTLTLLSNLNPGDGNLDGATDVSDRIIWNNNNFTEGTTWATGDYNNDGATDVSDRIVWNNHNFTEATAGPIAEPAPADSDGPLPVPGQPGVGGLSPVTVVPEPATMVLLGFGGLVALARRRRRAK